MKQFFITATDTDAGKTFVSCALIQALTKENKVAAFKPISAGCELIDGVLINEDAQLLSEFANCNQTITHINPIAFKEPIAPHIAAKKQNIQISLTQLTHHFDKVKSLNADITIVEGAGGWRLPLGQSSPDSLPLGGKEKLNEKNKKPTYQFLSDFVKASKLQVILIVNMKLGCLNHALLTYETIKADGVDCIAWIANCASGESMSNISENISELELLLPIPKIAQFDYIDDVDEEGNEVSFNQKIDLAAQNINLAPLFV